MLVFYSCLVNHRDSIKRIEYRETDARYVVFSNQNMYAPGWEVRPLVWTSPDATRTARYHKHHPFELFPECEVAVWLDMTHWAYQSIIPLLKSGEDLLLMKHQERSLVAEEVEACAGLDVTSVMKSQYDSYKCDGFKDDVGLYSTSCMIRRNTECGKKLSSMWWAEIEKWSKRDQLSLPYCLWKLQITPGIIPGVDRGGFSPYFKFISHYRKFIKKF
jgi:hypothetical protein